MFLNMFEWIRNHHDRKLVRGALSGLDDHLLADIGLLRSDIDAVLHGARIHRTDLVSPAFHLWRA